MQAAGQHLSGSLAGSGRFNFAPVDRDPIRGVDNLSEMGGPRSLPGRPTATRIRRSRWARNGYEVRLSG